MDFYNENNDIEFYAALSGRNMNVCILPQRDALGQYILGLQPIE
jgi:hypothetical protein